MMIRLNDSIGLDAFRIGTATPEPACPGSAQGGSRTFDGDFLGAATSIVSDVDASVRGSSVSQHAANVLWHLCGDTE